MNPSFRPPVPWGRVIPGDEVSIAGEWWYVEAVSQGVYTLQKVGVASWVVEGKPGPDQLVERRMGKALAASHARRFYSDPIPEPTTENYPEELLVPGPWRKD